MAASIVVLGCSSRHAGAAIPPYQLVSSFAAPSATFDIAPDGRIYALSGGTLLRQDALGSSAYTAIRQLPAGTINAFGASFMRFSPDGQRLAIGDGNFNSSASVHIVDSHDFSSTMPGGTANIQASITSPNFDAAWDASGRLFVTGARASDFVPLVNRIDFGSAPAATTVITGVGSASAGIAIRAGRLFTGSGFLPTGEVRSFDLASLNGGPVSFSSGVLIGSFLSASPLGFDAAGNLLVGGGDTFSGTSDTGYAAVVSLLDPSNPLRLAPAGPNANYSPIFNPATGELLIHDSLNSVFHRYTVPSVSSFAALLPAGVMALRRRRR